MRHRIINKSHIATVLLLVTLVMLVLVFGAYEVQANTVLQGIDTKAYPTVKLSISNTAFDEPGKAGEGEQAIKIVENGKTVEAVGVSPLQTKPEPLSVVLIIDSSGSMKGKPITDAKAAAGHFIGLLGDEDQVSVIAFNSTPSLVADFTSNKKRLVESINKIAASGETAVYDALSLAGSQISKSGLKQEFIVLLSDGGDTASKIKFGTCIEQLQALKTPVYTIALKSPEFDVGTLASISTQSGGKLVEAIRSSELKPFYSRLATQIKSNVEVEYESPGFNTKDIDLDIVIGEGSQSISVGTAYQNPAFLGEYEGEDEVVISPITDSWLVRSGILLIAFLATALLGYGVIATLTRRRSVLREQIGMYTDMWSESSVDKSSLSSDKNPYVSKALDMVEYFAEKRGFTDLVKGKLEQAGLPLRPVEYILFHALLILIPSALIQMLSGNLVLSVLTVFILTFVPMLALQLTVDRRQRRFNEMLPDTVTMVAGSLRAGYSLLQAIALVADESKPPVSVEFKRALTESRLGLPIEMALEKMAKRIGSEDFYWTVLAINIQREVGGNLAEVLDIVAKTIREREALKRHIQSLTAEGRLSAYILIALPFVVAALLFIVNPEYMSILFTHLIGWVMVGGAGVLMVIGIIWMKKIISIEV